jgi:uncharacterized protein YcfL
MRRITILIVTVLTLVSCSKNYDERGYWGDDLKLSVTTADFTAEENTITLTTGGDKWWIDSISFEDSVYSYYDSKDVIMESPAYTITEDQFVVERRNGTTLFVKLKANNTADSRVMVMTLQSGNYFDSLKITQSAD